MMGQRLELMRRGAVATLLAALLCLGGPLPAGGQEPASAATVGPNVRMNAPQEAVAENLPGRAGLAIAADAEGRHLLAAWDDVQGFCGPPFNKKPCPPTDTPGLTGVAYSSDGGRTWVDMGVPPTIDGVFTGGHPWLDRGGADNETFFLVSRARLANEEPVAPFGGVDQVGVTFHTGRFKDGVFTWEKARVLSPPKAGDVWRSPTVAAAKDGSGRVYVGVSNLRGICGLPGRSAGQIEILRSADGGETWDEPVVLFPDATPTTPDPGNRLCGLVGALQIAPTIALGPEEEVYVLWPFGPFFFTPDLLNLSTTVGVRLGRSMDGGRTFSYPRDLAYPHTIRLHPPVGYSKDTINDFFRIAVDTSGSHRGRIYVTYGSVVTPLKVLPTEQSLISSQVFLISSDDQGKTWTEPVPLGPPVPATGVKRLYPSLAVRPGGGVDVIYLESRETQTTADPDDMECNTALLSRRFRTGKVRSLVDLYWVHSADGGAHFSPPVRVTSETSDWCEATYAPASALFSNFGDYLGIFAGEDRSFAVWTDNRNGVPDAFFAPIEGGSVSNPAEPE